jgi:hypothetical protein
MGSGIAVAFVIVSIVFIMGLVMLGSMRQNSRSTVVVIPEWWHSWVPSWRPLGPGGQRRMLGPGGEQRYSPPAAPNLGPGGEQRYSPPAAPSLGPGGEQRIIPAPSLGPSGTRRPNMNPFPPVKQMGFMGSHEPALLGKGSEEGFENFAAF